MLMRALLLVVIFTIPAFVGCLSENVECSENCWKLDSNRLNEILLSPDALNVLSLAAEYENLSVTTTTQVSAQGDSQQGSIHWDVSKQAGTEVSSIGMSISIQGTQLDTEEVVSGNMTNIRVGSAWFQGRDARPEYVDPFVLLALQASADPGGNYPPFGFDPSIFSGFDWTITADELSTQQIATADDGTISAILELVGDPPMLVGIQMFNLGDGSSFRLDVETGDDVSINIRNDIPRIPSSITFPSNPYNLDDTTEWTMTIPVGFIMEVRPTELSVHGLKEEEGTLTTVVAIPLSDAPSNVTDDLGDWWDLDWYDSDADGLLSSGDRLTFRTNSEGTIGAGIWDLWADAWTGTVF